LLTKSPFEKGGFKNLQTEEIYGKRYSLKKKSGIFSPSLAPNGERVRVRGK
jgi:hypothetical protein